MHWIWLILLLAGVAVAVPALDEATRPRAAAEESTASGAADTAVRIPADGRGHFVVEAYVGGRGITMLADTGASAVALTEEDACRAGFNPSSLVYDVPVSTANGTAYAAQVTLARLEVQNIVVRDVQAIVAKPEALDQSLLGMTFLKRLREFSVRDGTLVLVD